jgi:hypothetical protein
VASFTALFDACVLYPAPLRDLLMHLALVDLLNTDAAAVCLAARRQRHTLKNPPKTIEEYLEIMARQQLDKSVSQLRRLADDL